MTFDLDGDGNLERVQILRKVGQAWLTVERLAPDDLPCQAEATSHCPSSPKPRKISCPDDASCRADKEGLRPQANFGLLYAKDMTNLDPQALDLCDLEGDGEKELFLKVKKATTYFPEVINRPFFFNFHDDSLYAKWTGSKFGDPFRDAFFIDYFGDGRDLVFIVGLLPEGMRISAHAWQGFGFQFLGESDIFPWIGELKKGSHGVVADLGDQIQEFVLYGEGAERRIVTWPLAEN